MRKFLGYALVEALMSLLVLGIVVPTSLSALGNVLTANLKIREHAYMISSAEWWFGRLTFPVRKADIDAAPPVDEHEKVSFGWDTENLDNGAIRVTLRVYGRFSARPFTVSRIF